jgi:hypothetical protein
MCVGIDLCSKKNCLENERCVLYEPIHKSPCEVRRGPKKKKKKNKPKILLPGCAGRSFCNKRNICDILGECLLDHKLVKGNPDLRVRFAKSKSIQTVLKVFNRLKPPVTLRGQFKKYKSRK